MHLADRPERQLDFEIAQPDGGGKSLTLAGAKFSEPFSQTGLNILEASDLIIHAVHLATTLPCSWPKQRFSHSYNVLFLLLVPAVSRTSILHHRLPMQHGGNTCCLACFGLSLPSMPVQVVSHHVTNQSGQSNLVSLPSDCFGIPRLNPNGQKRAAATWGSKTSE